MLHPAGTQGKTSDKPGTPAFVSCMSWAVTQMGPCVGTSPQPLPAVVERRQGVDGSHIHTASRSDQAGRAPAWWCAGS